MTISSEGVYYLVVMVFILTAALIRQINLLMVLYGVLAAQSVTVAMRARSIEAID